MVGVTFAKRFAKLFFMWTVVFLVLQSEVIGLQFDALNAIECYTCHFGAKIVEKWHSFEFCLFSQLNMKKKQDQIQNVFLLVAELEMAFWSISVQGSKVGVNFSVNFVLQAS